MNLFRQHKLLFLLLVVFLLLGATYSVVNPLFESPDEVWHYEYVRWLVEGQGLPRPEQVGSAPWHQEGSQPPLYYLAAAALTWPIPTDNAAAVLRYNPHAAVGLPDAFGNKNIMAHGMADAWPWRGVALAAHIARFFSLLLGAVTVLSTYGAAYTIFPEQPAVTVLAAALVAFNPQFLFISAAVNNDNLVTAASAVGIWLAVRLLTRYGRPVDTTTAGRGRAGPAVTELLALGAVVGVAALAKLSGLALASVVGLALILTAWLRKAPLRTLLLWGLISAAAALAVAGWWYGRNLWLYGDPLGLQAMFDILPRRTAPPTLAELVARSQGVWRSAWAVFGWFNVVADEWLYAIYTVLSLAGLAGLLIARPLRGWLARRARAPQARQQFAARPGSAPGLSLAILVFWLLLVLGALISWAQMRYPQGRLLFPALSAAAILLAWGLTGWLPRRLHATLVTVLALGLGILAALAPVRWIAPAYAAPQLLPATAQVPNPAQIVFGDQMRLVGYELDRREAQPGDTIYLTLYWEALRPLTSDYSIFVHLVDESEIVQAQHDSYPAAGSLPTREWPGQRIIPDRHAVHIPDIAPAPQRLRVEVGAYDFATGARLPVAGGDSWTAGAITLAPRISADGIPNPIHINFADQIALIGFEMDRRAMQPGETLTLTLWWEALAVPTADYTMFAHLLLPPDAVWAGADKPPADGAAPTSGWQPGQRLMAQYRLTLPPTAPAGLYKVEVGIYDPITMRRLSVNFSDAGIVLGNVRVE